MPGVTGSETGLLRFAGGSSVTHVAFSADGGRVATVSADLTARMLEATTGEEKSRFAHQDAVVVVAVSPDGRLVATGSLDGTARIIELATGKEVYRIPHDGSIYAIAFSARSRFVVIGSETVNGFVTRVIDATPRNTLVDLDSGVRPVNHVTTLNGAVFSSNSRWVATLSGNEGVRVIEAATGSEVYRIDMGAPVSVVRFSRDDRWLEIVHEAPTGDGLVYARYPLAPDELVGQACATVKRNLTVAEWTRYAGPEIPYERTCEELPFPPDYRPGE